MAGDPDSFHEFQFHFFSKTFSIFEFEIGLWKYFNDGMKNLVERFWNCTLIFSFQNRSEYLFLTFEFAAIFNM